MSTPPSSNLTLAVVVITRNEAARIGTCLESILTAASDSFSDADIVVVDSDSSDDTTTIAARYPVRVFRYKAPRRSAAAGRWIGLQQMHARYVLFVDGDCEIVPGWLELAIARMEADPSLGVICGSRQNAHVEQGVVHLANGGNDLGGTALYRHEALVRSNGFNPFIIGSEEQELCVRLESHGYRAVRMAEPMSVHHTAKKESIAGMWRRHRSGMQSGPGQVLRVALRDGLFMRHARRFDRYILTFLYLALGVLAALIVPLGYTRPLEEWIVIGVAGFLVLAWRRRSFGEATFIVADWISVALGSFRTFLRRPRLPEEFAYTLECIPGTALGPELRREAASEAR